MKEKCIQCHMILINIDFPCLGSYDEFSVEIPTCENLECPNYGLLQTGILPIKKKNK